MAFDHVVGTAVAYLDLDTTKFTAGLATVKSQLATLTDESATFATKTQAFGNAVTSVGTGMTKTLTPALALVAGAGVKASMSLESALTSVESKLMSSSDDIEGDMAKLKQAAIDYGGSTKFTAEEVANAFDYMALAGWDASQMLDAIPGVLDLAASSGMDLARASDVITDYLSAFNKESGYAVNMADMLAYAQANTNTTADQLSEAFANVAVNAAGMGQEMSTTISLLSQMAQEGLKGSEAGTALSAAFRDMMQKSQKIGSAEDLAANAASGVVSVTGDLNDLLGRTVIQIGKTLIPLDDLNGSYRDMYDIIQDIEKATSGMTEVDARNAMMMTFTSRSIKAMGILVNEGSDNVRNFTKELENSEGTAKEMSEKLLDNLAGSITLLTSAINAFLINVGDRLAPYIRKLADFITELTQKINGMSDAQFDFYVKLGAILMIGGPILIIVGKFITGIGTIIGLVTKLSTGIVGLSSKLTTMSGGFTAIKTSVAGLGAKLEGIGAAIGGALKVLGGIGSIIAGAIVAIKNFFDMWKNGFDWLKEAFMVLGVALAAIGAIILGAPALVAGVVAAIVALVATAVIVVKDHWEEIKEAFRVMGERIKEHWENVCNWFKETSEEVGNWFKEKFESLTNWLKEMGEKIKDGVSNFFNNVVDRFKAFWENIKNAFEAIRGWLSEWFLKIKEKLSEWFGNLKEMISEKIDNIWEKVKSFGETIKQGVETFFGNIYDKIKAAQEFIVGLIHKLGEALNSAFEFIFGSALEKLKNLGSTLLNAMKSIIDAVTSLFNTMKGIFEEILAGLGNAILKIIDIITNGVKSALEGIQRVFQAVVGTFAEILTNITKTIGEAFTKAINFLEEKITSMWERVKSLPGKFLEFGKSLIENFWNGLKNVWENVKTWFDDHFGWILDVVNNIIEKIKSIADSDVVQKAKGLFSGSHANGLDYVPYDGYIAQLHQGERVLTKSENESYNERPTSSGGDTFIFNNTKDDPYEYAREIKRMKKEMAFA